MEPLTFKDIEEMSEKLKSVQEEALRGLFSCFKDADYDRGDQIIMHSSLLKGQSIPEWASHVIHSSGWIESGAYYVVKGNNEKVELKINVPMFVECDPRSILRVTV
jgi:hypothetical protein